jgi:hypothetical protein
MAKKLGENRRLAATGPDLVLALPDHEEDEMPARKATVKRARRGVTIALVATAEGCVQSRVRIIASWEPSSPLS